MPMSKFRLRPACASVTEGNLFSPLAISILRLFGNEARHSQRSPHLHMVRVFAVENNRSQALSALPRPLHMPSDHHGGEHEANGSGYKVTS